MIDKILRGGSLKMKISYLVSFLISLSVVSCKEYVPVLLWGFQSTEDSSPAIPALSRLSRSEFSDYLLKKVKVDNPTILLFIEENLSVEDFSWRDVNQNGSFPQLTAITKLADDVAFLPAVHDPYKSLKKLQNHGYKWKYLEKDGFKSLKDEKNSIIEVKLEDPDYLEDRPDMLRQHDAKIAEIYEKALNYKSNILGVYTGNHTSWIDAELGRFKREERDNNSTDNIIVINDDNSVVMMVTSSPIVFRDKSSDKVVNITKAISQTVQVNKGEIIFRVRFLVNNEDFFVNFNFTSVPGEWWTLQGVDIKEIKAFNLKPSVDVGAPSNYSFFCNPTVVFKRGNLSLTFENFQVQPRPEVKFKFGPVHHCIPYFSIEIWSGLLVVFILSVVLAWGIVMIMDINTNDRFDDPKGKTITITATD